VRCGEQRLAEPVLQEGFPHLVSGVGVPPKSVGGSFPRRALTVVATAGGSPRCSTWREGCSIGQGEVKRMRGVMISFS
jgi:hypothetical protein